MPKGRVRIEQTMGDLRQVFGVSEIGPRDIMGPSDVFAEFD